MPLLKIEEQDPDAFLVDATSDETVAEITRPEENPGRAAEIVHRCNSHPALVAALQRAQGSLLALRNGETIDLAAAVGGVAAALAEATTP